MEPWVQLVFRLVLVAKPRGWNLFWQYAFEQASLRITKTNSSSKPWGWSRGVMHHFKSGLQVWEIFLGSPCSSGYLSPYHANCDKQNSRGLRGITSAWNYLAWKWNCIYPIRIHQALQYAVAIMGIWITDASLQTNIQFMNVQTYERTLFSPGFWFAALLLSIEAAQEHSQKPSAQPTAFWVKRQHPSDSYTLGLKQTTLTVSPVKWTTLGVKATIQVLGMKQTDTTEERGHYKQNNLQILRT